MKTVGKIGYWSAILSTIFAIGYSVPQIFSTLKLIPHPQDLVWLFVPSLFLAPAFLIAIICLHYYSDENLKIWTALGVAFALLYAGDISLVYFTQLTVIIPQLLKNEITETHVLAFHSKSFLMAVDCLGYFFMSLSTFFAAFAFSNVKWLFRGLLYNGLLLPVLVLAFFYPVFYYVGALWMITFPVAMLNTARLFREKLPDTWHVKALDAEGQFLKS